MNEKSGIEIINPPDREFHRFAHVKNADDISSVNFKTHMILM
jgi:hypothetical protein